MKALAVLAAALAACAVAAAPVAAAPVPVPVRPIALEVVQPEEIAVPASVVAAHPDGHPSALGAEAVLRPVSIGVTPNAIERVSCWRAYLQGDNSSSGLGTEREWINPYWCGNGAVTHGLNTSWHGQSCSFLVSCAGESGIGTWFGCPTGCSSVGQQITGHFRVDLLAVQLSVDETVVYQLYANGQYWSYGYHN